jgi:hypothetical protein
MDTERIQSRLEELFQEHRIVFWNDPDHLCLSSANEATPGTALSSCVTSTCVARPRGWPSAPSNAILPAESASCAPLCEALEEVAWLCCVPLIKGFDHLTLRCSEFEERYNAWRPHMTLEGLRPDDLYYSRKPETPKRNAKTMPGDIERHLFTETRLTAYRLQAAA